MISCPSVFLHRMSLGARFGLIAAVVVLLAGSVPLRAAEGLSVTVPQAGVLTWQQGDSGYVPLLDGLSLSRVTGTPALPYRDVEILLPPGMQVQDLQVQVMSNRISLPGTLQHVLPVVTSEGDRLAVPAESQPDLIFPGQPGEFLGMSIWNGYRIARVRLYPMQVSRPQATAEWSTASKASEYTIHLELTMANEGNSLHRNRAVPGEDRKLRSILADRVLNPDAASAYLSPAVIPATDMDAGFQPTTMPSLQGSGVEYVIITTTALESSFQALADYKTARGIPTVVRTISSLEALLLPAADTQTLIRNFIIDAYQDWGTRFVLLAGDVDQVPTRTIFNSLYPLETGSYLPVDLYYAGLDGNWNADGDENLGEPYLNAYNAGDDADMDSEIHLGRAPVRTPAEADLFISKIISYERDDLGVQNSAAMFLSEVLNPKDYAPGDTIYDDGAAYSEEIIDQYIAGSGLSADRYYQANDLWPGSIHETKASAMAAMNTAGYGIVNHIGHGFFYNLSVGDASISLNDIEALTNTNAYFLFYGLNCASAAFDYNCIVEKMVNHDHGGAVAAVGASRAAFPGTAGDYQKSFYQALFQQQIVSLGEAVSMSRSAYTANTALNSLERWTHMTLATLGDPTLRIWTGTASALSVTRPSELGFGIQNVPVTVLRDGQPLADATVCLAKDGDDYVVGRTDASGHVELSINIKSAGQVSLSVVGFNAVPWFEMLDVSASGGPFLKVQDLTFVDDGTLGTFGNGDGKPDSGETIALRLSMTNTGDADMTQSASAFFAFDESGVVALAPSSSIPPLDVGQTGDCDPILLQIDLGVPDQRLVLMNLLAVSAELSSHDTREFQIVSPVIAPDVLSWNDFPYGDGDQVPEAGEEIRVSFVLRNEGSGQAHGLTAWLETDTPGVTVVQGLGSWPDVAKAEMTQQNEEFIVSMTSITTSLRAVMHIVDTLGHEWIHDFDLDPPERAQINEVQTQGGGELLVVWDGVADTDIQGYHVYRSMGPNGPFTRMTFQPVSGGTFYRDSYLEPLTTYYYRITAIDFGCIEGRQATTVGGSTTPPELAGFPVDLYAETSSHPCVGDVDGDGRMNIITAADAVYVWNDDGTELRDGDGDPLTLGVFAGGGLLWSPAGITLGNLNNAPGMEIVASCRSNKSIYVFNGDGTIADGWPQVMNNWNWAAPAVGDLDNDGDLEVVVTNVVGRTYVWHHDGTDFYDGDNNASTNGVFQIRVNEWYSMCSPALADVDGDNKLEIILATRYTDAKDDVVHALKNNAVDAPGWPYNLHSYGDPQTSPSVGDLDNDGSLEIILVSESNLLHVIDQTGQAVAPFPLPFTSNSGVSNVSCPSPALGDLDGDGLTDFVVYSVQTNLSGDLYAYNILGEVLPGWPVHLEGNSESSPIIGDITGNGQLNVIFGIGGGTDSAPNELHAFTATGNEVPGFPLTFTGPVRPTPVLCDLDQDSDVDLVYGGWDLAMHVWDLPAEYNEALVPWPMFGGNPLRSGLLHQQYSSQVEDAPPLVRNLLLHGNVPNPFNPSTRIHFDLPTGYSGQVSLVVFDLKGRAVRHLLSGRMSGGAHHADWHGLDDSGQSMGSGVYLYRLQTESETARGRMVLIR